jgi:hypothetical protein
MYGSLLIFLHNQSNPIDFDVHIAELNLNLKARKYRKCNLPHSTI